MPRIKKVLLIDPPQTRPSDMGADKVRIGLVAPLGLAYIAAILEKDYEVAILDCTAQADSLEGTKYCDLSSSMNTFYCSDDIRYGLTDDEIRRYITFYNPDLVGVSCLFSNKAWDAHNVCRIVKEVNPEIITVMGGAHPTALPEETLKDNNVDYVVKGEGDHLLMGIIQGLDYYGHHKGQALGNDAMPFVQNLDSLPFPARHLLPMNKYLSGESPHSGLKRTPVATITTSRGCPGRCNFCAIRCLWGEKYRYRSPDNVLLEIKQLIDTYHIKELHFEDDCLTANKKRAMAIFQGIIDNQFDLTLNSPSGLAIFAMDEELIDKMREASYYSLSLAIESGVPEVLKLMNKKVDLDKAKRLVKYARSVGLKTKAFFILGYPGETKETMKRTVQYASDLMADWSLFFPATNLPGTVLDKQCRENGWLADPNLDYRYYFFKSNIRTPEFDPDFVNEIRDKANREINFTNNPNLRLGNYERAREDFQEIINLYPDLDIAKESLRRVNENNQDHN